MQKGTEPRNVNAAFITYLLNSVSVNSPDLVREITNILKDKRYEHIFSLSSVQLSTVVNIHEEAVLLYWNTFDALRILDRVFQSFVPFLHADKSNYFWTGLRFHRIFCGPSPDWSSSYHCFHKRMLPCADKTMIGQFSLVIGYYVHIYGAL